MSHVNNKVKCRSKSGFTNWWAFSDRGLSSNPIKCVDNYEFLQHVRRGSLERACVTAQRAFRVICESMILLLLRAQVH